jgi:RHH-type proline utilization regulon transcriptional repressor/proline dehydrogenase/delta 1-pyrroline-5-carboxylate dehydrogenase
LKEQFVASCEYMNKASRTPNRTQNRMTQKFPRKMGTFYENEFSNEPNTDWALA